MISKRIQRSLIFTPTETNTTLGDVDLGELIPMTCLLKSSWYILPKTLEIVSILKKKIAREIYD